MTEPQPCVPRCGLCSVHIIDGVQHYCAVANAALPGLSPLLPFSSGALLDQCSAFERALVGSLERIARALEEGNRVDLAGRNATREQAERILAFQEKATKDTIAAVTPPCPDCGVKGSHAPDCFRS